MKKILLILLACGAILILNNLPLYAESIKQPNVSGSFYPSDKEVLSIQIDNFLNKAEIEEVQEDIFALISPHAGYIYSGSVAAFGYKAIKSKDYKTVIILAPSHFFGFKGVSVWPEGAFRTPLENVFVDEVFIKELMAQSEEIRFIPEAFAKEHSLEVQIPFLQKVWGNNFKIVPIVMGQLGLEDCRKFALALKNTIKERKDVLVIASTDLSHYHPYNEAINIDKRTLSYIGNFDFNGLFNAALIGDVELCGLHPVITALILAKQQNANGIKILKYANSGDITGDKSAVVGYASIIIYTPVHPPAGQAGKTTGLSVELYNQNKERKEENMLNKEQREKLLKIARESMETYINTGKRKEFSTDDPDLMRVQGAFVTLTKKGELRGCIGRIVADKPLFNVVADMAIEASTGDPRFPPVTKKELSDIEIEISVLTPFERIDDVNKIQVGKHGIMMRKGFYSGLLLPQVATEYGWDRDTFLEHSCYKAGLPANAWRDKSTEIYIFSAEVFSEKSH